MAVNPVDMNSLKVEDVVITSTPQSRKEEPADDKPKDDKPIDKPDDKPADKPKDDKPADKPKDDKPADKPADKPDDKPKDDKPADDKPKDEPGDDDPAEPAAEGEFDWEALSEEVGIEIASDDDVVESLKELATYRSLSPALQKAIEIERAKGDVASYFKAIANDPKDLSDRDALWEQYIVDNPKRVAGNPKFARMDFDRKLDKEYELLTQYEKLPASERDEFLEKHKADLDYLKEKRKFDADSARATLQEKRDAATFLPQKTEVMDEKKAAGLIKAHETAYKKALAEFDVVSLRVGKDFEFNVGLTESNKKVAADWMKNPETMLQELGFFKDHIEYDTLAGWAALLADIKYGTFGDRFREAIVSNKDIKTLENTLDAPGIVKTGGEKPILQGDEWDQVGDAFEKKRMESKKRR